jgi:prostaglandin-H2 D-isomerase / glutathione transferase
LLHFKQPARLALVAGGIPFKDTRISGPEFMEMKTAGKELPTGRVPIMKVDGEVISESGAVIRYCGKLSGLYPGKTDIATARIDEVVGILDDVVSAQFKDMGKSEEMVKSGRDEFVSTAGPTLLGGLERLAKNNKESEVWMCGPSMTIADLAGFAVFGVVINGTLDHVPKDMLEKYPRIMASYNGVVSHPKLAAWHKQHA